MGFASGFTGGVAVTLSVAYLSVLAHQRNREQQGAALRAQALALQNLIDPLPAPLPPTRSEVAAAQRERTIEVVKDHWNHEVENAARWVQNTDWDEARETIERSASRLWGRAFGETPAEEAERVKSGIGARAEKARGKAEDAGYGVADAARAAYSDAKLRTQSVEEAAENKFLEARLWADKEAHKAEDKASEAKGALASAWEGGKDKARDLAEKAKAAIGAAEEKIDAGLHGPRKATPTTLDPVAKALSQRYEKPEAKVNRTVAEVLNERYTPIDKRDNTVLRGI